MKHQYDFFDAVAVEEIAALTWRQFIQRFPRRWSTAKRWNRGEYTGHSLRELIAFHVDPTPDARELEACLDRQTVGRTLQRSSPECVFLAELLAHTNLRPDPYIWAGEIREIEPLIGAATHAYLENRLPRTGLAAVVKLHRSDPKNWIPLTIQERARVSPTVARIAFGQKVFRWQKNDAFTSDEWTDGLTAVAARQFLQFVVDAWLGNWSTGPIRIDGAKKAAVYGLRHFEDLRELAAAARRGLRMQSPCVIRRWE